MPYINRPKKKQRTNNTDSRKERSIYYNDSNWRKLRLIKLKNNPLCEKCFENEIITPATQVHHITSFMTGINSDEKMILFLDYNNLMSICDSCHGEIHKHDKKIINNE